ncbi:MAG: hypothetical protein ACP5NQ_09985, partial [Vulcanisaeta sp.]
TKLRMSLTNICARSLGSTIHYLLPEPLNSLGNNKSLINVIAENLEVPIEKVLKAERVIAKALLEFLPAITLKDGCRVAVLLQGDQSRKITLIRVAMKCKVHGYKLGIDCPIANSLISRLINIYNNYNNKIDSIKL